MNNEQFGKFIQELRKEKGLTQRELSERLNVSDKAISRWENGKNYPDIEMLEELGTQLDVSISELIACKKIDSVDEANSITERAYIGEVKKGRKNKKLYCIIISILLIVSIICASGAVYLKKSNQEYTEQKIEIVTSDIQSNLKNIDCAVGCDGYLVSEFDMVCNGENEIEMLNFSGTCENMHRHYLASLRNGSKITYCNLYESKLTNSHYEPDVDLKTLAGLFSQIDFKKLDTEYNESKRYTVSLLNSLNFNNRIGDLSLGVDYYMYNLETLERLEGDYILKGTFAQLQINEINESAMAIIYVPVGAYNALNSMTQFFNAFDKGNFEEMKSYCRNEYAIKYFHDNDVFGFKSATLTAVSNPKYDAKYGRWIMTIELDAFSAGANEKTSVAYDIILEKSGGKWLVADITTDVE